MLSETITDDETRAAIKSLNYGKAPEMCYENCTNVVLYDWIYFLILYFIVVNFLNSGIKEWLSRFVNGIMLEILTIAEDFRF